MFSRFISLLSATRQHPLPYWPVWLLLCLATRLPATLHYIADPDSLRFALAVSDFDLASLRPHFPGYPVFCFLAKLLYLPLGRFAYAFSLIGGLATFLLLLSAGFLFRKMQPDSSRLPYLLLLFFCPMVWIMGNRYMPDLLGCALVFACFAAYAGSGMGKDLNVLLFFILAGLLAGVRLSYVPMVLLPALLLFLLHPARWKGMAAGLVAVLAWLVPMVLDTGWHNLVHVAATHTEGHFTTWGGTVLSEPSHGQRLARLLHFTWATGLGGYWSGRSWVSAGFSVVLWLASLALFIPRMPAPAATALAPARGGAAAKHLWRVLLASAIVYLLWMYFYQNVVHQSRHVLPLLPVLLLAPAVGLGRLLFSPDKAVRITGALLAALLLTLNGWLTLHLVGQHKRPTAIAQALNHLQRQAGPERVVATIDLLAYYLMAQQVPGEVLSVEHDAELIRQRLQQGREVVLVGDFNLFPERSPSHARTFYHNPYVNSLWPDLTVYHYAP